MILSKKVNILILIIITNFYLKVYSFPEESINSLATFNKLMEKIEYNLQNDMLQEACFDSEKALEILEQNIKELKASKPNYAWGEIESLLTAIPTQLC